MEEYLTCGPVYSRTVFPKLCLKARNNNYNLVCVRHVLDLHLRT